MQMWNVFTESVHEQSMEMFFFYIDHKSGVH
jgi:hypothetical protein